MSEQLPTTESSLWQSLKRYLEIETIQSTSEIATDHRGRQFEAITVRITVKNVAPDDPNMPRIVFTGVGLGLASIRGYDPNLPRWAKFNVRKQRLDTPKLRHYKRAGGGERGDSGENDFPILTSDEQKHGDVLFPGQAVIYELKVPTEQIGDWELCVEGNVSRRHFFHYQEVVRISQT